MARKLIVEIVGDASSLEKSFARAEKSTKRFGRQMEGAGRGALTATVGFRGLGRAVASASAGFLGAAGLVAVTRSAAKEFSEATKVAAQTEAALKSTGGAAGVTAVHIDRLASSISAYSGQDDEAVQAGENLLLTFTRIRNEAGKTNDIFDQATRAAADLSQAMGIDMTKAALQIGKALNDPARGYARLQRIGVAFTEGQVQLIKRLTESGRTLDAQKVILAELNREFGGSAKAFGDTLPGKIARLKESLTNLSGEIVGILAPSIEKLTDQALKWIQNTENQKRVMDTARDAVRVAGEVIQTVTPLVKGAAGAAKGFADAVGGAKDAIILLAAAIAGLKLQRLVSSFANVGAAAGTKGAAGQVGKLRGALLGLPTFVGVTVGLAIIANAKTDANRPQHGFASWSGKGGWAKFANDVAGVVNADWMGTPNVPNPMAGPRPSPDTLDPRRPGSPTPGRGLAGMGGGGTAGSRPTGLAALTTSERNRLALAAAGLTGGTADDLKALGDQRNILARQIASVSTRLKTATGKRAKELAATLAGLYTDDKAALADIVSINEDAASDAQDAAAKAKAATVKRQNATRNIVAAAIKGIKLGVPGGPLTLGQINRAIAGREQRAQYQALGLTGAGDARTPGIKSLRGRARRLADRIKGTPLDNAQNRSMLAGVGAVLAGTFGRPTRESLFTVRGQLDDLSQSLGDRAGGGALPVLPSSQKLAVQLAGGLGLTGAQTAGLQANIRGGRVDLYSAVVIDSREVGRAVQKDAAKTAHRTARQTSGWGRRG